MILRRIPGSRFSEVLPEWRGLPVVVIGGGPSLTMQQVEQVRSAWIDRRVRCIAVNDAYLWAMWADVSYFADAQWWAAHTKGTPKPMLKLTAANVAARFAAFSGQKCSIQSRTGTIPDATVHVLRNARTDPNGLPIHAVGLSLDPGTLITGQNGGWQALNLAVLAGANPIILLGIDGQASADGRTHWSGGHQGYVAGEAEYQLYRKAFSAGENELMAAGIRVINCSPRSAIGFEKMPLEEALCLSLTA